MSDRIKAVNYQKTKSAGDNKSTPYVHENVFPGELKGIQINAGPEKDSFYKDTSNKKNNWGKFTFIGTALVSLALIGRRILRNPKAALEIVNEGKKAAEDLAIKGKKEAEDITNPPIAMPHVPEIKSELPKPIKTEPHVPAVSEANAIEVAVDSLKTLQDAAKKYGIDPTSIDEEVQKIVGNVERELKYESTTITDKLMSVADASSDIAQKERLLIKSTRTMPTDISEFKIEANIEKLIQIMEKNELSADTSEILTNFLNTNFKKTKDFEKILKATGMDFDYTLYRKILKQMSPEDLEGYTYNFINVGSLKLYENLRKVITSTSNPKEKEELYSFLLKYTDKNPHLTLSNGGPLSGKRDVLKEVSSFCNETPDLNSKLKKQVTEELDKMFNSFWGKETEGITLNPKERDILMNNTFVFRCGQFPFEEAEKFMGPNRISTLLSTIKEKKLDPESAQKFKDIAIKIAQKEGQTYEDALKLHFEDGKGFNLFRKKGDKYLKYQDANEKELFGKSLNEADENVIVNNYINCGDDTPLGAYYINSTLRNGKKIPDLMKEELPKIDRIIADSEPLDETYTVFRALGEGPHLNQLRKVGTIFTDKGYTSTTMHCNATYLNMFGGEQGSSYVVRIKLPKGAKGFNCGRIASYLPDQKHNEFLLPRNSSFKVLNVDDKAKIIEAEYILPE